MAIKNRTCLCCSTKFSYCPDCSKKDALKPAWASEFCSEDCMTIWTTATKFNLGKLTKSEAKSIISALPLKPVEQYVKCVQRDLDVILKEEPKPKVKRGKRIEFPVIDETVINTVNTEIKEIIDSPIVVEEIPVLCENANTESHEVVIETIENE